MASTIESENPDRDRLRQLGRKVRMRLGANPAARKIAVEKAEMWAVGHFFDAVECGRLISQIDARAQPSVAYGVDYASGRRTSYTTDFDRADPFIRKIERRFDQLLGMDASSAEPMQGQRYTVGQEFKPHSDWFPPGTPSWEAAWPHGGQRAFTVMVYLNAVEEGGQTDFPLLGIALEPRQGTLLVWNNADEAGVPNRWTLHAGLPVTRGTKYILTRWYRCGRWQPAG